MFLKTILNYLIMKCKFAKKCQIGFLCKISSSSKFEGMNKIYSYASFAGSCGYGTYIGKNSSLYGKIGRFCSIGNNVSTNPGTHPYLPPFVSSAPCFYSLRKRNGNTFAQRKVFEDKRYVDKDNKYVIVIGNDVWICDNVFINPGIKISDGAVLLSHAVVTKDVPPYAIVGGIPAKIIGYRYDEETIDWLLKIQWWNNDEKWFKENWELMSDLMKLQEYYNSLPNKN